MVGFTYGVKPVMNDVYGSVDLLTRRDPLWVGTKTARAGFRFNPRGEVSHNGFYFGSFKGEIVGSAKYMYFVDNPILFTLDQLGVINPLSIGWELIPFSFVVDWFVPIGDALQSVVPPQGIRALRGWTYVKARGTVTEETKRSTPAPGWNTKVTSSSIVKDRKVITTIPRYSFQVPDLSLSKSSIASAVALLVQQGRRIS